MSEELTTTQVKDARLNMVQFRAALEGRGMKFSAGGLSELMGEGEKEWQVSALLGAVREGNRVLVPESAVDVMARFWPKFDSSGLKRSKAPDMLSRFLKQEAGGTGGELVTMESAAMTPTSPSDDIAATVVVVLEKLKGQGVIQAAHDALLDAEQVKAKIAMKSTAPVHHLRVKVGAANRWRESDIDRFIAGLPGPGSRGAK